MIPGNYGEYTVLVDGTAVVDGGAMAVLGILPSGPKVVTAVRTALGRPAPERR